MTDSNPKPRKFFVLYIGDQYIQNAVDAIRYLLNDRVRTRAHITIQARFQSPRKKDVLSGLVNECVQVGGDAGQGFFETPHGKAHYLRCDVPRIKEVWYKPSFSGEIIPHITLYEGHSKQSEVLADYVLNELNLQFKFLAGKLELLEKFTEPPDHPLLNRIDWALIASNAGVDEELRGQGKEFVVGRRDLPQRKRLAKALVSAIQDRACLLDSSGAH